MIIPPPDSSALPDRLVNTIDARQWVNCWRTIGILGDRSCPELSTAIHCHNCAIYTQTARELFNKPISGSDPIRLNIAAPALNDEVNLSSLGVFRIGTDWFALPAHLFQQVVTRRSVRPIPHRSNEILQGLVNIQGELLLCVSLKNILKVGTQSDIQISSSQQIPPRLAILQWKTDRWGFIVDEFHGIETVEADRLFTPPSTVLRDHHTFTHSLFSWNHSSVNCLDEELLFSSIEQQALQ